MQNTHKKIETLSNIAIIVVAVVLSLVMANRYFFSAAAKPAESGKSEIESGTKFPLSGVDWSKSDRTLVIVFSTSCRFCLESGTFYQKIAELKFERKNIRLVIATAQPFDQVQQFFREKNVAIDEIIQTKLSDINVTETPTLVLVDGSGAVKDSWVGRLPPETETELLAKLFGTL